MFSESSTPTYDEKQRGADRVEVYNCTQCNQRYRFARFNNPATLIETREGRCGEWANCFALCCRAIGLEVRYVTCTEDHAWVEVFDLESQTWIHLDPCENVIDTPLLYEKGWKKTINYVFAISKDHVQDVTWRYTFHHKETLQRRKAVRELVLLNCLTKLNQRLQKELPEERRNVLRHRQLREAIQLLNPKLSLREGTEQGRKSGGVAWRLARMEMKHEPVEINLTEAEKEAKLFVLEYDIVQDAYYRQNNKDEVTRGLFSYLKEARNIQRKVEKDWKVAYICRTEDSKNGDLSWRINLDGIKPKLLRINIGKIAIFHSGKANATLCGGNLCQMIDDDGNLEMTDFEDADHLELSVNFRGGDGEQAFQHSQLFRTSLCEPSISLRIELEIE
uniref:Peptide-N(4)-(N-acetyl-beta-glucosaminyl)asparagine amidase n=1 Tax=Bursaphelenchus xylophilus TaxID=6326 RepID=A0A1I7RKX9_BURXY